MSRRRPEKQAKSIPVLILSSGTTGKKDLSRRARRNMSEKKPEGECLEDVEDISRDKGV